ncbi:MAG: hypothetical protein MUF40_05445 [Gemmatimonadaceae bacterium]|nr:hypothetical protein [Gemmatimonadaceae bacterium]
MTASQTAGRLLPAALRRALRVAGAATLVAGAAACSEDKLTLANLNTPSQQGIDADLRQAVPLRATGILALERDQIAGFISDVGIHGRESFNYTPTELRNTTEYLGTNATATNSFNTGGWTARYRNMLGAKTLAELADRADNNPLSTAERAATRADSVAPFVRRDSVYRFILNKLDAARTDLLAGGGAFPFPMTPGFNGFNTPATFAQFNRAIYARVAAHLASFTSNAALYNQALTALGQSFLDDAPAADLRRGAYNVYSTASGDNLNGISPVTSPDQVAHPRSGPTRWPATRASRRRSGCSRRRAPGRRTTTRSRPTCSTRSIPRTPRPCRSSATRS